MSQTVSPLQRYNYARRIAGVAVAFYDEQAPEGETPEVLQKTTYRGDAPPSEYQQLAASWEPWPFVSQRDLENVVGDKAETANSRDDLISTVAGILQDRMPERGAFQAVDAHDTTNAEGESQDPQEEDPQPQTSAVESEEPETREGYVRRATEVGCEHPEVVAELALRFAEERHDDVDVFGVLTEKNINQPTLSDLTHQARNAMAPTVDETLENLDNIVREYDSSSNPDESPKSARRAYRGRR